MFILMLCREPTEAEVAAGVKALRNTDDEHGKLAAELAALEQKLDVRLADWEMSQAQPAWTALAPTEMKSLAGAKFTKQPDQAVFVEGRQGKDEYTITADTDVAGITGIRLEALADPNLPNGGPGRGPTGNFVLSEFHVDAAPKADPSKKASVAFSSATADFEQEAHPILQALDGNPSTGWAIAPQTGKTHLAVFETKEDIGHSGGVVFTFRLDQNYSDTQYGLGKFRLSVTTAKHAIIRSPLPVNIAAILAVAPQNRTDAQKKEFLLYYHSLDAEWVKSSQAVEANTRLSTNKRLAGAQDLAWALINSPAFLFNR
jgi:hypothetical protein